MSWPELDLPDGVDGWLGPVGLKIGVAKSDIPGWGLPKVQVIVAALGHFATLPMGLRLKIIRNNGPQGSANASDRAA